MNPVGISGEATKNSEPLDGRPETHGENEGHGVISMKFPSFSPKAVTTWSFLPRSIQILVFSYTERVVVYLVLSHCIARTLPF